MKLALSVRVTNTQDGTVLDRTFDRFPVRIGRSGLNDLVLDFGYVSNFHAAIERNEQTLFLRDLGARNGTMVAGQRAKAHVAIDLGPAGFSFSIGPLTIQMVTSMVPRTGLENRTAVFMALDHHDKQATMAWQALVDGPPPAAAREPRDVAHAGLRQLARLYVPEAGPLDDVAKVQRFLGKVKQSLDLLFGSFVSLRDGSRQFQSPGHAGRRGDAGDVVDDAKKPGELARAALDWRDPSNDVGQAMQRSLADFVVQQVALLDGVTNGVRAMLDELSPQATEAALAKKGSVAFGPFRKGALWKLHRERHHELSREESEAFAVVFGPEFVHAYRQLRAQRQG